MTDWDQITANLARTGAFHGKGPRDEDAYYEFFTPGQSAMVVIAVRCLTVAKSAGNWLHGAFRPQKQRPASN